MATNPSYHCKKDSIPIPSSFPPAKNVGALLRNGVNLGLILKLELTAKTLERKDSCLTPSPGFESWAGALSSHNAHYVRIFPLGIPSVADSTTPDRVLAETCWGGGGGGG